MDLTALVAVSVSEIRSDKSKRQSDLGKLFCESFSGLHQPVAFWAHNLVDCLLSPIVGTISRGSRRCRCRLKPLEFGPCDDDSVLCVEHKHTSLAKIVDGDRRTRLSRVVLIDQLLALVVAAASLC